MGRQLIVIGLGGATGSILRYLGQLLVNSMVSMAFPLGTFLVNISGCFLIGIFYAMLERYTNLSADLRLFLITGLCGGYTTFSSFSYEGITLFKQGNYFYFGLYISLSIILGLFATVAGIILMK